MRIQSLLIITGNPGKAEELQALLGLPDLEISHQKIDLTEIQSAKLEEIGRFKTRLALLHPDLEPGWDAVLTDDVGFYLKALNGLPGPFIKFFLQSLGAQGLYDLTRHRGPAARAVCCLNLGLKRTQEIIQFQGEVQGQVIAPIGHEGFGWDSLFRPEGESRTYAQMTLEEKNQISHRALATGKLKKWIQGGPSESNNPTACRI